MAKKRPAIKYERSCLGKTAHRTYEEARTHKLTLMLGRRGKYKRNIDVYRCDYCGYLHVGRSAGRPKPN
jgi:hypothetical protein